MLNFLEFLHMHELVALLRLYLRAPRPTTGRPAARLRRGRSTGGNTAPSPPRRRHVLQRLTKRCDYENDCSINMPELQGETRQRQGRASVTPYRYRQRTPRGRGEAH